MSEILHLVRKDLRRLWLPLTLLATCGTTALSLSVADLSTHPELARVLSFSAAFFFLLGIVTIGWLVQEDSARDASAFWRSRPIAPSRLIGAKLTLVGSAITLTILLIYLTGGTSSRKETLMMVLSIVSTGLACVAVAAITRNLGEYILIGALFAVAADGTAVMLRAIWPYSVPAKRLLNDSHSVVGAAVWIALSAAVLLVQYRTRRTGLSATLLGCAVLGTAIVKATWVWKFI